MTKPLHILFVEDSAPDAEEMLHVLSRFGFEPTWQRVESAAEFAAALRAAPWDVVISDYFLPGYSGLEALQTLRAAALDVPLIIVSGILDDDSAVAAMRAGANDFFRKDRLMRLGAAIERELAEVANRRERDAAKRLLQESEQLFRLMVETAQDYAIFMLDPAGVIATWNAGAERMFGYPPAEAIGRPHAMLGCGDLDLTAAVTDGRCEEEALRTRKDGTYFWTHAITLPLISPDGSLKGFSRITRDIDQKKRNDEALTAARQIADEQALARRKLELEKAVVDVERKNLGNLFRETSAIVAVVSGPEHRLEFSNPAFTRLMGGDHVGQEMRAFRPQDVEVLANLDVVYASGSAAQLRGQAVAIAGETLFLDFAFAARRTGNGEVDGVMILATDVTEQLRARRSAEASSASKSAFLANMSHEIRTPLGAILGFTALLKDPDLDAADCDRYIDTINRNGKALTRIIDDILDLAKVEAGRLEIEEITFSLHELLEDVVELFQEKAKEKGIFLRLNVTDGVPGCICSDPTRLRQILFNIVGNAIKFTETGGVIVHVNLLQSTEGALRLSIDVEDSGCGLSDKQRERLFQPFTQADNTTTRQFGGTGLGLALAKRLCEALGGSITIGKSSPMTGSVFTITFLASLPPMTALSSRRAPKEAPVDAREQWLQDIRVLVVDDAKDNLFLVKRFLTRSGATVDVANNGFEGVDKALTGPHDVVLMDIQMPGMDGYQAVEALRSQGYTKPIIALTAHALVEERARTKAAGFAGHLTKPLDHAELVAIVAQHAGRTGLTPQ